MTEQIDQRRRLLSNAAAMTIATAQMGPLRSVGALQIGLNFRADGRCS
jgi:hypothetical protein